MFLAAVAAFFFVSYNLFFPVTVQASPVLGLAAAVEDLLYFAPAGEIAAAGFATGGLVVAGALAAGALGYEWGSAQTTGLNNIAFQQYCVAVPGSPACAISQVPTNQVGIPFVTNQSVNYCHGAGICIAVIPAGSIITEQAPPQGSTGHSYQVIWPGRGTFYDYFPDTAYVTTLDGSTPVNGNFNSLSPAQQNQALQALDDSAVDVVARTGSPTGLQNGQVIPSGTVVTDPTGQKKAFITTGPYTVGSGQPIPGDPATCTSDCSAFNQGTGTSTKAGTGSSNPLPANLSLTDKQKQGLQEHPKFARYARTATQDPNNQCISATVPGHLGNAPDEDPYKYATQVSGSPDDYFVLSFSGVGVVFDGLTPGTRHVWEAKHGYFSLINPNSFLTQNQKDSIINDMLYQALDQNKVANECQYQLTWAFSNESVANYIGGNWEGNPAYPQDVRYIPYSGQ